MTRDERDLDQAYKPSFPPLVRNRKLYELAFGIEDSSSTESTKSLANCGSVILYDHVRAQVWSKRASVTADVRNATIGELLAESKLARLLKSYNLPSNFTNVKPEDVTTTMVVTAFQGIIAAFAREAHHTILHDWLTAFFYQRLEAVLLVEMKKAGPDQQSPAEIPAVGPGPRAGSPARTQHLTGEPEADPIEAVEAELQMEQQRYEVAKINLQRAQVRQQRLELERQISEIESPQPLQRHEVPAPAHRDPQPSPICERLSKNARKKEKKAKSLMKYRKKVKKHQSPAIKGEE